MYALTVLVFTMGARANPGLYRNFSEIFNPLNYMNQLPSLSLPYVNDVPIPSLSIPLIKPSPVVTTKVINVVTKYVTKNPVCIKVSGKKLPCRTRNGTEFLVTKEYFVAGRRNRRRDVPGDNYREHRIITEDADEVNRLSGNRLGYFDIQGSEYAGNFGNIVRTPTLNLTKVKELLIEDRLNYLESILPQYTRLRVFETKTVTVTKQLINDKMTATLVVKNCIPQDMELCPTTTKRRKHKPTLIRHRIN